MFCYWLGFLYCHVIWFSPEMMDIQDVDIVYFWVLYLLTVAKVKVIITAAIIKNMSGAFYTLYPKGFITDKNMVWILLFHLMDEYICENCKPLIGWKCLAKCNKIIKKKHLQCRIILGHHGSQDNLNLINICVNVWSKLSSEHSWNLTQESKYPRFNFRKITKVLQIRFQMFRTKQKRV